ncbi:MAG TPA: glutamate decarboxylase [Acidimicrobiales bacterium]|jgi:glutamate decarboxylase|nr:glutamate decarboxylase [Acidimicrobiales bacterium]
MSTLSQVPDDLPSTRYFSHPLPREAFPETGMPARDAYELIHLGLRVDGRPSMNLASFVTTWMEPEARALIAEAQSTNHIDHEEYPIVEAVEQICVRMLADLWNAPDPLEAVGVATIGSSEAIMLGLLAHKFRWRARREAAGLPADKPNVIFGAETHIVWDKFARYFDVEMRKIPMRHDRYVLEPSDVLERVDENTIAVGAVIGTTFIGENDPVKEINDLLVEVKRDRSWDIPIHVDGASGGFIAPFAHPHELWDFRLEQVASINASGHKYGLVYPGVGWLVLRSREFLPDDLVFSVNYLGGAQPTFTFNFSRNSAMIQAQYYQFIRLGRAGYQATVDNMMANASYLNDQLVKSGHFEILNPGLAEPVVTFRLLPGHDFDEYHLADRLALHRWIVPAYTLPPNAQDVTVLRVVVRNDMSRDKIDILLLNINDACEYLQGKGMPDTEAERKTHEHQRRRC